MLESKLSLAGVPGVGLPENGVSVSRHDLPALEGAPDELLKLVVGGVVADLFAELLQPDEHFLIGETVERSGQTVHASGEGQVRIGQG